MDNSNPSKDIPNEADESQIQISIDVADLSDPILYTQFSAEDPPITLPCGHTFAMSVIDKIKLRGNCPQCRAIVPKDIELKKNIALTKIISHVVDRQAISKAVCDKCTKKKAMAICLDDGYLFCDECLFECPDHEGHKKQNISKYFESVKDKLEIYEKDTQKVNEQLEIRVIDELIFSFVEKMRVKLREVLINSDESVVKRKQNANELINKAKDTLEGKIKVSLVAEEIESSISEWEKHKGNFSITSQALEQIKSNLTDSIQALDSTKLMTDYWLKKGKNLISLGMLEQSISCFNEILKIHPTNSSALKQKGMAYSRLEKIEEALECFDEAIKINPKDIEAYTFKGNYLNSLKKFEEAVQCFDQSLHSNPQNGSSFNNKGASLFSLGQIKEALDCYDQAIKLNSKDSIAHSNKGAALFNLGKNKEAIECYNLAIQLNPMDAAAFNNKGAALCSLGQYHAAINCYDVALRINPRFLQAFENKKLAIQNINKARSTSDIDSLSNSPSNIRTLTMGARNNSQTYDNSQSQNLFRSNTTGVNRGGNHQ